MTVRPVLAATGLLAEARIAAGAGVVTIAGGGDPARFALLLQGALRRGAKAVISFGIAGGLAPHLRPGDAVVARAVLNGGSRHAANAAWVERLATLLPRATVGDLTGQDRVVASVAGKASLHRITGALAVDMESHIAARLAAQHGVPFAALRIVADPADRTLPRAATVGLKPDGATDARAVLRALSRQPGDLPGLIRTAFDARAAFAALRESRRLLGAHLGFDAAETQPTGADARSWEGPAAEALEAALFGSATPDIRVENP